MSRILRRPMFRGGMAIDSRGTGITSGLFDAPSYAMGVTVDTPKRGVVDGPGSYSRPNIDLTTGMDLNPNLSKPLVIAAANTNTPKFKGKKYYEEKEEAEAYVPKYQSMEDYNRAYEEDLEKERENVDSLMGTEFGTGTFEDSEINRLKYKESDQGKQDFIAKEQAKQDKEIIEANKYRDQKLKTSKEMFKDDDEIDLNELKIEEKPEVDPKDLIKENQSLFAELLGADKARGQDIGDMLLRFAGAPGSTTQEKFQTYLQAESQAGKGRAEKINETAAALAINDYVAGKRSKENLAQTLAAVDYKIDKTLKGSVPQPDDDWRTAVFKAAGKDDSISSDKTLGKALAGKFGKSVASVDIKEIADLGKDKVKEELIIGFNIVTLKDGNKVIVEKSASGEVKIREDLPVLG